MQLTADSGKVEHVITVIKRMFGFTKFRYRGLAKNAHALFVLCALTNLYMARRRLLCLSRMCESKHTNHHHETENPDKIGASSGGQNQFQ